MEGQTQAGTDFVRWIDRKGQTARSPGTDEKVKPGWRTAWSVVPTEESKPSWPTAWSVGTDEKVTSSWRTASSVGGRDARSSMVLSGCTGRVTATPTVTVWVRDK